SPDEPTALFSGDFLFVGSVGRPDLLGEADKLPLARAMYKTVSTKLKGLPDSLEVYPAHGAGSLCGAGMGKAASTTLGDERKSNIYLDGSLNEQEFTDKLLAASPEMPDYYLRMKKINSEGPANFEKIVKIPALTAEEFAQHCDDYILDVRHPLAFGGAHLDGAINIGMPDQLSFWAGWVVPYDRPVFLVTDDEAKVKDYVKALGRVGIDTVAGYLSPDFNAWVSSGQDFIDIPQVSVHFVNDLMSAGEKCTVLDVRSDSEWKEGHIKGAKHIYLGNLPKRIKELKDKDETVFCICGGGYRSSVAASILQKEGFEMVHNVFGGMSAWKAAGYSVKKV
ncbi:MAG: rhodanese-like domain-containing protein, partial [Bacteroidota bacterium]|nr:rhodanese-like domain-containing protein [Bacteroidota bacterium]